MFCFLGIFQEHAKQENNVKTSEYVGTFTNSSNSMDTTPKGEFVAYGINLLYHGDDKYLLGILGFLSWHSMAFETQVLLRKIAI